MPHPVTNWAPFQYKNRLSRYGDLHYKHKTVVRPSYLYDTNPYIGKTASLNLIVHQALYIVWTWFAMFKLVTYAYFHCLVAWGQGCVSCLYHQSSCYCWRVLFNGTFPYVYRWSVYYLKFYVNEGELNALIGFFSNNVSVTFTDFSYVNVW